jgi:tetratricopeptide (TPR) repeat protein
VFAGGWSLEAAETVVSGQWPVASEVKHSDPELTTDHWPLATEVLDRLTSLVDRSLVVVQEAGGSLRYRMLETVREYAREKLRASGEEETVRAQHLGYFLQRAETAGLSLAGTDPAAALALVENEIDNFRAALAWTQTQSPPAQDYQRLAAALWPFWEMRGYHTEGREYLRAALDQATLPDAPERAQLSLGAATLAFVQAELGEALALGRESVARFRALEDPRGLAGALVLLGHVSLESGEVAAARALLAEGLEFCRQSGWTQGSARAFMCLGAAAEKQGDALLARSLFEQGLSLAEAVRDAPTAAFSLRHLGELALGAGDYGRAGSLLEQSLQIWRRLGHKHQASLTLRSLGWLARRQGDLVLALSYMEETVATCREQGNRAHLAIALCELGSVLYAQGDYERAHPAYAESVDLLAQADSAWGPGARNNLGSTLFHLGDPAGAQALHREALAIYYRGQTAEGITWSLERLGVVEARHGDGGKAARLMGAAAAAREGLGTPLDRWDQTDWDQAVGTLRAGLPLGAFEAAWAEGQAISLEQAVELALSGS